MARTIIEPNMTNAAYPVTFRLKLWVQSNTHPYYRLLRSLGRGASVVDIGCGNHSPKRHKYLRPDIRYVGVDIQRYNLDTHDERLADRIVIVRREHFAADVLELVGERSADLVALKHVIEHVEDPPRTISAAARLLKPGGRIFLAFPAEHTPTLPSAIGTLNFYDDPTHKWLPRLTDIRGVPTATGLEIETVIAGWSHPALSAVGAVEYAFKRALKWVSGAPLVSSWFLWSLFKFESIVIARRKA